MTDDRLRAWTYYDEDLVYYEIIFPFGKHTHAEAAAICAKYSCAADELRVEDLIDHNSHYGVKTQVILSDGTRHPVFDHEVIISLSTEVKSLRNDD
jgi:hypothetical protein